MKKVFLTGGNGFVGTALIKVLLKENIEVYALCRNNEPKVDKNPLLHIIRGDLSDTSEIEKLVLPEFEEDDRIDVFYHLAWNGVQKEDKNNYEMQIKNITCGMNALKICDRLKCKRFVNSGTVAEYVACNGLINDIWSPSPNDIYGATKVASRYLMQAQANITYKIDFINTILCSTYGEARLDDNVISYTIKTLLQGEKPIYGSLQQMWDFLYVEDVARAFFLIGEKGLAGETYSIGSGHYRHLKEYVCEIRDAIDPKLELGIGVFQEKYSKVLNSCIDSYLLQRDTGFVPEYSFEQGIVKTIEWYRNNEDLWKK